MKDFSIPWEMPLDLEFSFEGRELDKPWVIDVHPSEVHLAGPKPDLKFERCEIHLGNRPIAVDFQRLAIECLKERIARAAAEGRDIFVLRTLVRGP